MNYNRPFLVIPKLIEQPTWGGSFIVNFKGWQHVAQLQRKRIGQSLELFSNSFLSPHISSNDAKFRPSLQEIEQISLKELVNDHPQGILGKQLARKQSGIQLLIKFTQALGNSFQLHVKQPTSDGKWIPKPESWYFFAPGKITLGIKPGADWKKYQANCQEYDNQMQLLSQKVRSKQLTFNQAQNEIHRLLKELDPWQFVNMLTVAKNAVLDLTACGIHHSWEEDPTLPHGNLVYELQVDAPDDISTIRSFDKGKMQHDGTIRTLHIDDYFRYIDRNTQANDPKNYFRQPKRITKTKNYIIDEVFTTNFYAMRHITFTNATKFQQSLNSYHHIFVKSGTAKITAGNTSVEVTQGHAVILPAMVQSYEIQAEKSTVLLVSSEEKFI
ncbi:hypothetical protein C4564_01685 [Candidatus Microgenomates bacterium]|nr:MAG: hypothetical protein C4564_01685 [Candidatus Microgenomates bacterium]